MPPQTTITSTAKWIGTCKAGQQPGDMTLASGAVMNIRDVPGIAGLLPPAQAQATLPPRKPGLWEIRSTFAGGVIPPQSEKHCVNADLDREMMAITGIPREKCTQTVGREGDAYVLAGRCAGAIATRARVVISGDFQSAISAQISLRREDGEPLAPGLLNDLKAQQDLRWVSACDADMQPGDILLSNGTKQNIREMRGKR
jgi:hypothetical protein